MSTRSSFKKTLSRSQRTSRTSIRQLIGIFAMSSATIMLLICGTLLVMSLSAQASPASSRQHASTTTTRVAKPTNVLATATQTTRSSIVQSTPQAVATPESRAFVTPISTPLPTSTPQNSQVGVFSLSSGGPLPIPESVFHPTNIARVMLNGTLTSIYAGSLAQSSQAGALCVLNENLTTGQIEVHMYQSPRTEGPLTILSVQNIVVTFTDTHTEGTFDLSTNTFQW